MEGAWDTPDIWFGSNNQDAGIPCVFQVSRPFQLLHTPVSLPPVQAWVEATDERVTLTWKGNSSNWRVSGYRIERNQGGLTAWDTVVPFQPAANRTPREDIHTTETYVDTDVLPSARYHYRIRSVYFGVASSRYISLKVVTAVDPPGLSIFSDTNRVTIRWDEPEDDSITGYRILRRVDWGPERTVASNTGPGVTEYVDRQVSRDTAYAYRLQALRGSELGARSRYIFALTSPAQPPTVNVVSEPAGRDLASGTETTGLIVPGGRVTGTIESLDDHDWFAVDLEAGQAYHARLYQRYGPEEELISPDFGKVELFCLRSADGTFDYLDDNCPFRGAFSFEVEQSGRYYITVAPSFSWRGLDESDMPIGYELELDHDVDLRIDKSLTPPHGILRTSSEVEVGTLVSGHFHNRDHWDQHRVNLCGGRWYRVPVFFDYGPEADGVAGNVASVDIRTAGTNALGSNTSPILFRAWENGTYYVNISRDTDISTLHSDHVSMVQFREMTYKFMVEEVLGPALPDLNPASEPASGDLPADKTTTGYVPFGARVTGNIGSTEDRDWFRVRFDGRTCEERVYWLEAKGADTDDGTLEDPLLVGIYDAQGNYIQVSHVPIQHQTWDNDSGLGRNPITDFTPPGPGDYFVEVAGFEGSTGTYQLSVTDITDTSTSRPADSYDDNRFFHFDAVIMLVDGTHFTDLIIGNLVPGQPATVPAHNPKITEPVNEPDQSQQGGKAGFSQVFRLGVELNRNYRVELKYPATTDGKPANVALQLLRAYNNPEAPTGTHFNNYEQELFIPGDLSLEFKATPFFTPDEEEFGSLPSRWHASFNLGEYHFEADDVSTFVLTDITDSGDDYLGAEETTGRVTVGGSATGNLEVDNDVDWFRVPLEAGKTYRMRMSGSESNKGTLDDPFMRIDEGFSGEGLAFGFGTIKHNDDKSETEKDSELALSPTVTQDYYVIAATKGTGTGTYTIEVDEVTDQAPQLVSYKVTSDPEHGADSDTYALGDTITFEIEYDQKIAVVGDPQFRFNIGDAPDEYADYVRGSGSTRLVFSYTVQAGDSDPDGIFLYGPGLFSLDSDDEIKGDVNDMAPADYHIHPGTFSGHKVDATIIGANAPQQAPNTPATDPPAVSGTPRVGETLAADTSGITDADGLVNVEYAYQWLADDADIDGATGSTYTVAAGDEGKTLKVRVTFTDDAGNEESLTSDATAAVTPPALYPKSATVDGETLVLTFDNTLDEFVSLPTSAFTVTVGGATRTVSDVSVSGAAVTLTLASPVDAGETVKVDYARPSGPDFIRDTQGNRADSFTDRAVVNQTPASSEQGDAGEPFTAAFHDAPESHDGEAAFTFELRLSEEPEEGFSYVTMRDHVFTVTEGSVAKVSRLDPPGNMRWRITVQPDSGRDVTVLLLPTTDCEAQGAICTGDGRMLSSAVSLPVPGPSTPATGAPAVRGTAKAGQTLTADSSGIGDADGMDAAAFEYRWLADDAEVAGATNSSYALTDSDVSKVFRVRVSFTDDNGNRETLTSQPTDAVAADSEPDDPQAEAPGAPQSLTVATAASGQLAISWAAPDSDGGSEITGYKVQWKESSGSWDTPDHVSETTVSGTSHTITGLTDGAEYAVRVRAVNSAGTGEAAETTGAPVNPTPLTAWFQYMPESHNGSEEFNFYIGFSEDIGISYKTMRDHALTVTGGEVVRAARTDPPSNIRWEITVRPDGDGSVTIVLPVTEDCGAQGAICTGDGRMLSNRNDMTVSGPGG